MRSTSPLPAPPGRPGVIVPPAAPDASFCRSNGPSPAPAASGLPSPGFAGTSAKQGWEDLPPEVKGMIVSDLKGRDLSRFSRSAHSSSQSSAASLLQRDPPERNAQLAQLVAYGAAPTIATLLQPPNDTRFDWGQRDATGATLLMRALRDGSSAVVEALMTGPPCLFAGTDAAGWNILHHAVSRGRTRFLHAMLERHPALAAYADFSGHQTYTPLRMAYAQRDEVMFGLLLAAPVTHGGAPIAHAGDPGRPGDRATARPQVPPAMPPATPPQAPPPAPTARLELLKTAIDDNEPVFARMLLNRLDPEALTAARENILRAVTERGQFAMARIVIDHLGERAFAPLSNGATLCHLAAGRTDADLLHWVLRKPATRPLLGVLDDDGRTPLQCAAAAGSVRCFAALHPHYPDLSLHDAYRRGALQLLFRADPAAAHQVLEQPTLQAGLTPADLTATLQAALRKLLEFDFEAFWRFNDENTLAVNTDLVETLLSLPVGRIDVHAPIGESGHSALSLLQSGVLARLLERGGGNERHEASETIRGSYSYYQNQTLLALALAHRGPTARHPNPPAAPPPGSAAGLL